MKVIKIRNWARFQHFRDRKPIWVKLYRDLLDDVDWFELDGNAAKTLVMLWLIASEDEGTLPDLKALAFRLHRPEKDVSLMISRLTKWLEVTDQIDIVPISTVYNDNIPRALAERERREEIETEGETEKRRRATLVASDLSELPIELAEEWIEHRKRKRANLTPAAWVGIKAEALKAHMPIEEAIRKALARGWTGFDASWVVERVNGSGGGKQAALEARNRAVIDEFVRRGETSDAAQVV